MKKQSLTLFSLLVAGLLICACSSSDDVVDVADVATTVEAGNAYVKVTLNTGNSSVTRATDTYDEGTEAERAISSTQSIFLFYDKSGDYITYGTIVSDEDDSEDSSSDSDSSDDSSTDSSTDYTKYATIVLGAYNVTPTQMLAVLNIGDQDSIDQYKGLTLTEMMTKIAYDTPEYSDESSSSADYFVMSNALRYSGGALTYGLTIDEDAIYESKEDAQSGETSHEIFVEREVAKVKISSSYSSSSTDDDGNTTTNSLNNSRGFYTGASSSEVSTATVTVDLDGFAVNAINTQGYIVKQYDDGWTSLSGWYDDTSGSSNRFLWAQDANYDYTSGDGIKISASTDNGTTTYTTTGTGVFKGLKFLSYNEAAEAGASASTAYYHENTASYDAQEAFNGGGEEACVPTILAVGHITLNVTATNDVSAGTYDLSLESDDEGYSDFIKVFSDGNVYMSNSSFFTLNAVKEFIVKDLGSSYVWIKGTLSGTTVTTSEGETAIALDADDLTLTFEEVALDNTGRIQVDSVTLASSPTNATTTTSSAPATRADDDPQYYLVSVGTDDEGNTTYTAVAAAGSSSVSSDDFITAINKTSLIVTGTDSDGNTTGGLFCFTGGKLYYQAPIEHLSASSDIDGSKSFPSSGYTFKGLVRNHYYIIDITAITGLGWPVYNEDEPLVIIPGTEKEYYINCTINVLDWYKHDTQEVEF